MSITFTFNNNLRLFCARNTTVSVIVWDESLIKKPSSSFNICFFEIIIVFKESFFIGKYWFFSNIHVFFQKIATFLKNIYWNMMVACSRTLFSKTIFFKEDCSTNPPFKNKDCFCLKRIYTSFDTLPYPEMTSVADSDKSQEAPPKYT